MRTWRRRAISGARQVPAGESRDIEEDKAALDPRMRSIEARYRKQFTAMDTLLAQMNSTSSYLAPQFANLPKPGG